MALLRRVATVGGYTMVSRVLGFVREILTASALGAGATSDAFFVALRLPNLFRTLFAEGAFSAAFVPLFAGMIAKEGREFAMRFAQDTFSGLLTALIVFLILGEIFTPAILHVVAPGFDADPRAFPADGGADKDHLPLSGVHLARLVSGRTAQRRRPFRRDGGDLHPAQPLPHRRPAPPSGDRAAALLGGHGGGVAQCLWLFWSCRQAGLRLGWPHLHVSPELRRLMRIMLPRCLRRGCHADQPRRLHRHRLPGPGGLGLLPRLCRPAEPAAARRGRRGRRHRHPAHASPATSGKARTAPPCIPRTAGSSSLCC